VKYKEKYEKARGKAMLDFETPTYVTAKEAQHMQSAVNTHYIVSTPYLIVSYNKTSTLQSGVSLMLQREHSWNNL
jgi:hypothetical protein